MNDLIVAEKIAQWQKLKALVLDSVSSPNGMLTSRYFLPGSISSVVSRVHPHFPYGLQATADRRHSSIRTRNLSMFARCQLGVLVSAGSVNLYLDLDLPRCSRI
jgi:hypothetical protein